MKVGSLYSGGIDAFGYAVNVLKQGGEDIELSWQVEKRYEAHQFLKKNYPNAKRYFNDDQVGKDNLEWVDLIAGGDPCQPNSNAGLRLGKEDYRYRWPQMFRICRELRPNWIVNENVAGSVSNMVLDQKISDLESIGYTCQAYNIPAVAVGAFHERQRIFIVAHSNAQGWGELLPIDTGSVFETYRQAIALGAYGDGILRFEERFGEPAIFPISHGIPNHILRLGAAGDSIASPIPIILLKCIIEINRQML